MAPIRPKRTLRCPNIVSKTAAETTKKRKGTLERRLLEQGNELERAVNLIYAPLCCCAVAEVGASSLTCG
eukprot:296156-Pyramimonas_sp.AAC.1